MKTSEFYHYYVNDALFIDFEDAMIYCEKLLLPYSAIEKTKEYR